MARELKDWLKSYLQYTQGQQSPTIFHLWSGISTIASALRRRCWIDMDYYIIYPNLYVCLVSPTGVGSKTTAIKIPTDTLLEKAVEGVNIMRGELTIPYLIDWMNVASKKSKDGSAEVTILCEEFRAFTKGIAPNSGLIVDMTKLYDCGVFDYGTRKRGLESIEKPCINLLAGSTPEWLSTGSAADFIGGGFSSRLVPIGLQRDERSIAWPKKGEHGKLLEEKLIRDLNAIGKMEGKFTVTPPAEHYFKEWYDVRIQYKDPDERLAGYYAKKHTLVLKLSMILSASESDETIVEDKHIETALRTLLRVEKNMQFAYSGVAWGELAKHTDRILGQIAEAGTISLSQLARRNQHHLAQKELKEVIEMLVQGELVKEERVATGHRPKVFYHFIGRPEMVDYKKEDKSD